ncbi:hypothetical protein HC928_24945 [bacterium]|nr:hypothetical protein [bacterium]
MRDDARPRLQLLLQDGLQQVVELVAHVQQHDGGLAVVAVLEGVALDDGDLLVGAIALLRYPPVGGAATGGSCDATSVRGLRKCGHGAVVRVCCRNSLVAGVVVLVSLSCGFFSGAQALHICCAGLHHTFFEFQQRELQLVGLCRVISRYGDVQCGGHRTCSADFTSLL